MLTAVYNINFNVHVQTAGVVALAKALETNTVLRQLTLTKNSVGEEGAVASQSKILIIHVRSRPFFSKWRKIWI